MTHQKFITYTIWGIAAITIFVVLSIFGWKVFYGYVVPQVNNVAVFSTVGLFSFAALAGIMVNFGPCSFAVLPAFMSFYLASKEPSEPHSSVKRSLKLGAIAASGVITFFVFFGIILASLGTSLVSYAPQLKLAIALIILIAGILLFRGKSISIGFVPQFQNFINKTTSGHSQNLSLFGFGIIYGAGGLGCFLPILLPLIFFPLLSGKFFESVVSFIIFGFAQALFLISVTVFIGQGKHTYFKKIIGKTEMMKKVAGVVLILTSIYMFGIYVYLGM